MLRRCGIAAAILWVLQGPGTTQEGASSDRRIGILLAAGDIAACYQDKDDPKHVAVAKVIKEEIDKAGSMPVGVLALGDIAYSNQDKKGKLTSPTYADCFKAFEKSWGEFYDRLLPVPGNHDFSDDPTKGQVYRAYFEKRLKALGADDKAWFFATRFPATQEGWLLVGLNFYRDRDRQQIWLKTRLSESPERCVLAFTHPFIASSGDHGRATKGGTYAKMQPFVGTLHNAGASVLLSAHDHDLEQFARQDGAGKAAKDGIRSFVAGTGGAHLYPVSDSKRHPLSEFFSSDVFGVLKLELYPDHYTWSFVTTFGKAVTLPGGREDCNARKRGS